MIFSLDKLFLVLLASMVMGSGVGYGKIYFFHVALVLFFFVWFFLNFNEKTTPFKYPKSGFIYFLYLMLVWYVFTLVWTIDFIYTLRYLYYILVGVFIVFIINSYVFNRYNYQRIFNTLSFFFLIAIVISLLEVFTPFRLPTSPYSDYASYFGRSATDFIEFDYQVQALIKSAPTAFWGNPNNLAVSMVILLPFFLLSRKFWIKTIGASSILMIITMSGSRGAFIAFIFGFIVYFFVKGFRYWLGLVFIAVVTSVLLSYNIDSLKEADNQRLSDLAWTGEVVYNYLFEQVESNGSVGARQQLIKNGLEALWQSNGLGVGGGGSQAVQELKGGVAGKLSSMHNFWVEVLVDAGVLFFVMFLAWYSWLSLKLYFIFKSTQDPFYKYQSGSLFISLMIFLVAAVSASSVIYLFSMWLLFAMSIGLLRLRKMEKRLYENCITCGG